MMLRSNKQSVLIALAFAVAGSISGQVAHADDMSEGEKLYKTGRVAEAAAYFKRAVETNSYNASAHYFLGNCLVAEKKYVEARSEYRQAMEETDDKKMEGYCRSAMDRLQAYSAPAAPPTSAQHAPRGEITTGVTGADEKAQRVRAIIAKSKADAKVVMDRAEERCRPIMNDEKDALATMNIRLHGRSGSIETTTSDEREDTRKDYEQRITAIKKDAKNQSQAIIDRGIRDATSIGQGLPNLDDLLENKPLNR